MRGQRGEGEKGEVGGARWCGRAWGGVGARGEAWGRVWRAGRVVLALKKTL